MHGNKILMKIRKKQ